MADLPDIGAEFRRLVAAGAPETEKTLQQAIENSSKGSGGILGRLSGLFTSFPADIMRNIKFALLAAFIGAEAENVISRLITERRLDLDPVPSWLEPMLASAVQASTEAIGAPFFELLIRDPLGVDLSALPGRPEAEALRFVERIFGIGAAVDFGTAELESLLSGALGSNAPKGLLTAVRNIPWNVGANWATGFFLSQVMTSAAMPTLQQAINRQFRPTKLSPANYLALARMGRITDGDAAQALANHGYTDPDIGHLFDLDKSPLGISDMQQAWLFGIISSEDLDVRLRALGFNDTDRPIIKTLYFDKAETAGAAQLRAVLQRAFLDGNITADQYHTQLLAINVPPKSADLEVEAATLAKTLTKAHLTVADIKRMHAHALVDDAQAIKRLVDSGYSEDDASVLVQEWNTEKVAPHTGMSESLILKYLVSGILTPQEATDRLISSGIRAEDAAFLVAHPTATAPIRKHDASKATVIAAFTDGIIDFPTAQAKLESLNYTPDAALLELQIAAYKINRGAKPKLTPKRLSEAQILETLKYGLATPAWAERELVLVGYSQDDAHILVAIEETKLTQQAPADWTVLQ
jgi:hypothetical protein